ncbi:TonB-dependent siderophore receptor [Moraxellaceae bacterium AER2_44_116]|nr:TonB-dependent siderophore receptor [Moraxellaceae bacterium]TQC98334.1 TonB-dependent siderophore receptor [Moraxellaceae bacterium AER2_44_116]
MKAISSRKHARNFASSLMAVAGTLALPIQAQEAPVLDEVRINASADVSYKAEKSASPKLTQALVDTPKTVQVLKKEMLQEQGAVSLMEALRNTPGITMQLGENGNTAAGDTFQMRGFSTQASTFVDGVRDLGAVTRDIFNVEQVEVVKGAAGADIGRGASSGYINLVSKLPSLDAANQVILTLGTDENKRLSIDTNQAIDSQSAFRLNVVVQEANVAERDVVSTKNTAIAPAFAFGLETPTRVYVYSQHIRQDNMPDGGIPTLGMEGFYNATAAIQAGTKANKANFYGSKQDEETIDADMLTTKIEHDLGKNSVIRNTTRYGKSHIDRVLTGVNALSLNATTKAIEVARTRQRLDQTNDILANQTTINSAFNTATIKHDMVFGVELLRESQLSLGTTTGSSSTTTVVLNGQTLPVYAPLTNVYQPNYRDNLLVPYLTGANTDGQTTTTAMYLFDTLSFSDALKLNVGVRADHYETKTKIGTLVTGGTGGNLTTTYKGTSYKAGEIVSSELSDSDTLISWNLGSVFKPTSNSTLYAALANSQTPPAGANFALSATAGNQANSELEPQKTTTAEVGTKWELLNKRLNVSTAIYRTENEGQTTQDAVTGVVSQEAKTRVDGVELAVVGQLTHFWQLSAGVGLMESEQLNQRARNATSGVVTITDGVRWSPDVTASLWTSYTLNKLTLGGGARYLSEQKRVVTAHTDLTTQNMPVIPAYVVMDVMAAYQVSKNAIVRLNIYNLFNEEYISTLNNSGARASLGAPFSAALSAQFSF